MRRSLLFISTAFFFYVMFVPKVFSASEPYDFDYLIRNAVVFDGRSTQGEKKDIGIKGAFIADIGRLQGKTARHEINAKGLVLSPGFIDAHTHSDFNPLVYPNLTNKVEQGVTTEIVGNCGMSAAPVIGLHAERIRSLWAREGVTIPQHLGWSSFLEYRQAMDRQGLTTNLAGLIGHGNLRSAAVGMTAKKASPSDLESMKKMLSTAMEQGAFGISYGLVYLPGIFADQKEIVELCREAGRHAGLCAFHMRSEGGGLLESIQEVIDVAAAAQTPVQISHLKAGGEKNWGKIELAFSRIEMAQQNGIRIEADAYPYEAGYAELGVVLPDELYKRHDRNDYFRNVIKRQEILEKLRDYDDQKQIHWDKVMIASTTLKTYQRFEGMTLKQIAKKTNIEPEKFLIDILSDTNFEVSAFYFSQNPEVVQKVIDKDYVAIGSDSIADGTRRPHPRVYGTFPKVLREFVREKKEISLGQAIRKMTSLPADHFGIKRRGRIEKKYFADLVLFDAGDIKDQADYKDPKARNKGIEWVFVNGRPVVEKGIANGTKPGIFLTRQDD